VERTRLMELKKKKMIDEIRRRMEWYSFFDEDIECLAVDVLLDYVKNKDSLKRHIKVVIVK
jgi:hypothetical protein